MTKMIRMPSPALIVACLALVVALGPAVRAANTVFSTDIVDKEVKHADLASNSVTSVNIYNGSVTNPDLGANSVTGVKVLDESLTTADIAGAAFSSQVNLSPIANGRCTQVSFTVSGAQPGDVAFVATGAAIQNGIIIYAQRVRSANTVEANACNFSGAAMTAISNLPIRVVTLR